MADGDAAAPGDVVGTVQGSPGGETAAFTVTGREGLPVRSNPENVRYLRTKRDRMGHLLDGLDEVTEAPMGRPVAGDEIGA